MIFREAEDEKEGGKLGADFSPVSIHITLQNFSDLRRIYRAIHEISAVETHRGFSGWSTWDELEAFIKSKIDKDLLK